MRRQIIVMFFGLFCLALAPARAQPAEKARERGALFKADAGGHTLYLFGTMHVGLPEFYPLEPRLREALAGASVLALEIDPAGDPAAMARSLQEHGLFAAGSAGYGAMAPAQKARLERVLAERHMTLAAVAPFKPWLLTMTLTLGDFAAQGYRADLAVDAHLAQLARAAHVPVIELESVGAQLSMFSRLPAADQWRFLEDSLDAIESGKQVAQVREIADAWRNADRAQLDALAEHAEQDMSFSGRFVARVMLAQRNGPLADKLAQLLARERSSVAAIGVLHLVGKDSVPVLLRRHGVAVERLY